MAKPAPASSSLVPAPGRTPAPAPSSKASEDSTVTVLIYSDDVGIRAEMKKALGRRPAADVPRVRFFECATEPAVIAAMDAGGIELAILDGEARPAGGMGICRQLKEEIYHCPPVIVLTGRAQDNWLAAWSRADAAVPHPIDPMVLANVSADALRLRRPGTPVSR